MKISSHHKGFPPTTFGLTCDSLSDRLSVLNGDFLTPLLVLKRSAFERNVAEMSKFCKKHEISLAPHVKTTMSPEIASAQLDHGAWGITLATPSQVMAFRALGAQRILLANELVDAAAITWLIAELERDPEFECYCYVDSSDGVDLLEKILGRRSHVRKVAVIVEIGIEHGRTGVRDREVAIELAERVASSEHLQLAGIGGFEGIISGDFNDQLISSVRAYIRELGETADKVVSSLGVQSDEFIVTVGGSAYIPIIANELNSEWRAGRPIRVVLRSGCYVTHDTAGYEKYREFLASRFNMVQLVPSLELWSAVLSRPEPNLAIMDFGKRDAGIDAGFPVPLKVVRRGSSTPSTPPTAEIVSLNDQHAYLRSAEPAELPLDVGDRICFGISHPCTTLDKWRLFPMVDDEYIMKGAAQTLF
ncbi:alanine racemase [Prauserella flavalba]|uniref:alanine racemase n=1 Tax=Prauserella flavalba TaxID=1477506 RepID=UPI0036EEF1F3